MMKKRHIKIKKDILNYTVIFEPAQEGGFIIHVPALPGCRSQGETLNEAYQMAEDAIYGYIKTLQDLKEEIPREMGNTIVARIAVKA